MEQVAEKNFVESLLEEGYILSHQEEKDCSELYAVIMCGKSGYAIPVTYIDKIVHVPTDDISDVIKIGDDVIPLILLDGKLSSHPYMAHRTICIICQNDRNEKTAFYVGKANDSYRIFITTFPTWKGSPMKFDEAGKEMLGHGFCIVHGQTFGVSQMNLIKRGS